MGNDSRVFVSHQRFVDHDFRSTKTSHFVSDGCRFENCNFEGMVLPYASFGEGREASEFVSCSFDGSKMTMGPGGKATYISSSFRDVSISTWFCTAIELVDCVFTGKLYKALFSAVPNGRESSSLNRSVNRFEGNDFSGAELRDCSFRRGVDLTVQKLPSGDDYFYIPDAVVGMARARVAVDACPDTDTREEADSLLRVLERNVSGGQEQLLVRPKDYPVRSRAAVQWMLEVARDDVAAVVPWS